MAAAADRLKIVMFLGSVREGRMGLRVARFLQRQLEPDYDLTLFDPDQLDIPLLKKPLFFYEDRSKAPQVLLDCEAKMAAADAFIVISAEYNYSIPPALSNLMDHFATAILPNSPYAYKPSGIVCYSMGINGGVRVAVQLQVFLSALGTVNVNRIFSIPEVHKAFDEEGNPLNDRMVKGLNTTMTELDWLARALKSHRERFGVPSNGKL